MKSIKLTHFLIGAVILCVGLLTACSKDEDKEQESVFDTQIHALDKARELDDKLQDSAERTRKRIEEQR